MTRELQADAGYIDEKAAAQHLKLAPVTLALDRCYQRMGIPYYRLGRAIRYRISDLDAWMETRKVNPRKAGAAAPEERPPANLDYAFQNSGRPKEGDEA